MGVNLNRRRKRPANQFQWAGYSYAVLTVAGSTAAAWAMFTHVELSNLIMVYLLGILLISSRQGLGPSTLASFLSVMAFDFFFVEPRFTFAVSDTRYVLVFFVMFLVGTAISSLTVRVRQQAQISALRERRTAALYALSRELVSTWGTAEVLQIAVKHIGEVFESSVVAFLPDANGRLQVQCGNREDFQLTAKEMSAAHWAFDLGQTAGRGTDTLPGTDIHYLPLLASGEPVGALGVKPLHPEKLFIAEQMQLLEAFAHQTALAVAANQLLKDQQRTQMQMETEKLRSALLSAVSHDLRTPLAAITGSSSSLLENGMKLDASTQKDLLENIHDEANRLERLVNNLLEMTKLESGAIHINKQLNYPSEIIGSAVTRMEKKLTGRELILKVPQDLPMVPMDGLLIEQVVMNLLENALKYTPAGTPIEISALADNGWLVVRVSDRGAGLPMADMDHVFEKFYRGQQSKNSLGAGLGLSICEGFIQIHGGKITAENRPEGGAIFTFLLPMEQGGRS